MNIIAHLQFGDKVTGIYNKEYLVTRYQTHIERSHNSFHPDSLPRCDSMEVTLDNARRLTAMTAVTIGDKQLVNCAQGVKTSIQDGQLELHDNSGWRQADDCTACAYNGTVTIDGDEFDAEQNVTVRVLPDSVYVLVQKRF